MTNTLIVPKITTTVNSAADVPQAFAADCLLYIQLENANWSDQYPYKPKVCFAIAHCDSAILIHYRVDENCIRSFSLEDNGPVWQDACCEFFIRPDETAYYNFETNCIGTLLLGSGPQRENRQHADSTITKQVERWASLERTKRETTLGDVHWELAVKIPVTAFFKHHIISLSGRTMTGNVYKCGDKLAQPHFLSLFPIALPSPDFHRPDFFGTILFQ